MRRRGAGQGERRLRVTVVVLGDVGRSPRTLYHALALASTIADVDVIGYAGSPLPTAARDHERIRWHLLSPPAGQGRPYASRARFLVYAAGRTVADLLRLWRLLFTVPRPDVILVQNPPAVPSLLVAWAVARLRRARLVIDWHNLGHTVLALRLGPRHPLVRLARRYELTMGRRADAHLCVSRSMQAALRRDWGIDAVVFHDRPEARFSPTPAPAREEVRRRLGETVGLVFDGARPALLVSPTSWTADEDFSILLDAARRCDALIGAHAGPFPPLLVLITGRGPLRERYEREIARLSLTRVHLRTLWLAPEDYPPLLGAADLGLCLHRSSSGLDLPIKLADMFGSGIPVCALDYGPCVDEQVQDGINGLLFTSAAELADQLYTLFRGFPDDRPLLDRLTRNVRAMAGRSWADEWSAVARPVFEA